MQRGRCKVGELGEIVGRRYFCRFQLNSEKSLGSVQRVLSEDVGSNSIHLVIDKYALAAKDSIGFRKFVVKESSVLSCSRIGERWWRKERNGMKGGTSLLCGTEGMKSLANLRSPSHLTCVGKGSGLTSFHRAFASNSKSVKQNSEKRKDISTVEDPFDDITYNIPQKPVTFVEGASYSLVILAGLAIAGAAGYAVFNELIFEPKEYKVFGKALERVQNDGQVKVRIGSPITGYGHESRNRAARQRIPNRQWTDESGVDRIEVNFHIRGPQGAGVVYCEMFKDKSDKKWKFTYVIVDVTSPSPVRLMLESYVPK